MAIYNLADEAVIVRGRGRIIEDEKEFRRRTQQHIDKYRIALDEHGRDNMRIPLLDPKIRCVIEVGQEKILFW